MCQDSGCLTLSVLVEIVLTSASHSYLKLSEVMLEKEPTLHISNCTHFYCTVHVHRTIHCTGSRIYLQHLGTGTVAISLFTDWTVWKEQHLNVVPATGC